MSILATATIQTILGEVVMKTKNLLMQMLPFVLASICLSLCTLILLPTQNGLYVIVMGLVVVSMFVLGITIMQKLYGPHPSNFQTSFFLATILCMIVILANIAGLFFGNMEIDWKRILFISIGTWVVTFLFGIFYSYLYSLVKKNV